MIGKASATTTANGTYSLAVTASGKPSLSVTASGYYTRASAVAMTGGTTINPEIIPQGDGFDLAFFDDTFRVSGGGTRRWVTQPTIEILSQQLRCVEPCSSTDMHEVTADLAPALFEQYARETIAEMSNLSGSVMTNPIIRLRSFPVGTQFSIDEVSDNILFKCLQTFPPPYETNGGSTGGGRTRIMKWLMRPLASMAQSCL